MPAFVSLLSVALFLVARLLRNPNPSPTARLWLLAQPLELLVQLPRLPPSALLCIVMFWVAARRMPEPFESEHNVASSASSAFS
jgi:hypothetical protein